MDVTEAVSRMRAGDTEAFSVIVLEYQAVIRGFIAMYIFDPEDVLNLSQETFLTAFKRFDTYESDRSFLPWLRGIARNLTLKYMRDTSRRRSREACALDQIFHEKAMEDLNEDGQGRRLGLSELRRCLEKLKRKKSSFFRVVDMRYFKKMSIGTIAGKLETKEGSVRMVLLRTRQVLKDCIEREMSGSGTEV